MNHPTINPPILAPGYRYLGFVEVMSPDDESCCDANAFKGVWYPIGIGIGAGKSISSFLAEWPSYTKDYGNLYVRRKIPVDPVIALTDERNKARVALDHLEAKLKEATEIRAGDWVIGNGKTFPPSSLVYSFPNGPAVQEALYLVTSKRTDYDCIYLEGKPTCHASSGNEDLGWQTVGFRRATEVEIAEHLKKHPPIPPLPKLHGYDGVYKKGSTLVVYGCATLRVAMLKSFLHVNDGRGCTDDYRYAISLTLDSGKTLTLSEISAILMHVDYVDSH